MKIKNCFSILSLLLVLCVCFSCKDNDDDQPMDDPMPEVDPLETCCATPPTGGEFGDIKVYLPNAFTPNGDGINDIFYVQGNQSLETISINSLQIFANADVVFEQNDFLANNPGFGWSGLNMDGVMLPDSVYSYSLNFISPTNGNVTLLGEVCMRSGATYDCVDMEDQCAFATQHDGEGGFEATLATLEDCN